MANKHSVRDDGDPRKYYAAIPNIVLRIGLNPFELTMYVYLKQVAGEDGTCWKSTATISKECHMSAGMVSKSKASLATPRPELNGKPLIQITTEMHNGGNPNHAVTITDIWPENMAELERVRTVKASRSLYEGTPSPDERARSRGDGTRSQSDTKEELLKKNPEEAKRDFLSELKTNRLYRHIDFDYELAKMRDWLARPENKSRRLTERFVINWINKIDRPVELRESSAPVIDRAAREAELRHKMGWDKLDQRTA